MTVLDFERGGDADLMYDKTSFERFLVVRDAAQATTGVCGAHLANWEVAATAPPTYNIKSNFSTRRPNIGAVSDAVIANAGRLHGPLIPTGLAAPVHLANAIERGEHVGMLVDSISARAVDLVFFGRWAKANPLIAQLHATPNARSAACVWCATRTATRSGAS